MKQSIHLTALLLSLFLCLNTLSAQQSVSFDGINDYLQPTTLVGETFTLEFWAKVEGGEGTYRDALSRAKMPPMTGWLVRASKKDNWQFWLGDAGAPGISGNGNWHILEGPSVTLHKWTHVAVSYDGITMKMYIDGEYVGQKSQPNYKEQFCYTRIGAGTSWQSTKADVFFRGKLSEVRFWTTVRSQRQISDNKHERLSKYSNTGLKYAYHLDDINYVEYKWNMNDQDANTGLVNDIPPQYSIGSNAFGGVVFYIAQPGEDLNGDGKSDLGLVAQKQDINPSFDGRCHWEWAKMACNTSAKEGFNNWHLPSMSELKLLWAKRDLVGNFKMTGYTNYWTSTTLGGPNEVFNGKVHYVDFSNGGTLWADTFREGPSRALLHARAIRVF